jgi:hypothetical protein
MSIEKQFDDICNSIINKTNKEENASLYESNRFTGVATRKAPNRNIPGKASAYKSNGKDAFSYKQCIRTFDEKLGWIFNVTKYSQTTSKHQSYSHAEANYPKKYHSVEFSTHIIVTPEELIKQVLRGKGIDV